MSTVLWQYLIFVILIFAIGIYCVIATYNLVRLLIGLELTIKSATLLLIVAGSLVGHPYLTQSMVITLIVIEVVVMVVSTGVVLNVYRHTKTLDTRMLRKLKG